MVWVRRDCKDHLELSYSVYLCTLFVICLSLDKLGVVLVVF